MILPRKRENSSGRLKSSGYLAVGKVVGPYRYDEKAIDGCKHQRKVEWIKEEFPVGDMHRNASLTGQLTVYVMRRITSDELEESLKAASAPAAPASTSVDEGEIDPLDIKGYIQDNFQGHQLCYVVEQILEALGYECNVAKPGPDGGIDIVASHRELVDTFFVQVKHSKQQGSPDLDKFHGAISRNGITKGFMFLGAALVAKQMRIGLKNSIPIFACGMRRKLSVS